VADRLNILFLAPYLPFPPHGGGQLRIYHLLRHAAERHHVHLLSLAHSEYDPEIDRHLRQFGPVDVFPAPRHSAGRRLRALLRSSTPDMVLRGRAELFEAQLRQLLQSKRFDVVQAESIEMAQYGRSFAPAGRSSPLFCYDAFNAEYLLQRRAFTTDLRRPRRWPAAGYSLIQWRRLLRYERGLRHHWDLILAVSEADRTVLRRLVQDTPIELVPNGVETAFFRPEEPRALPAPGATPYLLFTGTLDFRPNVDALRWFAHSIWPKLRSRRPDLRFYVAGQRPAPEVQALGALPGITVAGPVDDMRPWFNHAAAYVLPMRVGGGVRLKLLETWAMGLPCVTTSLGAEGVEGFVPGTHALVADTPGAFVEAVEGLLDDRALAKGLAAAGRALVVEHYDWRAIAGRLEAAWNEHLARDGRPSSPGS